MFSPCLLPGAPASPHVVIPLVGGDPVVRADDPEPSVYALLDDPAMKLVMKSDGIHRTELLLIVEVARMRLKGASAPPQDRRGCPPLRGTPAAMHTIAG